MAKSEGAPCGGEDGKAVLWRVFAQATRSETLTRFPSLIRFHTKGVGAWRFRYGTWGLLSKIDNSISRLEVGRVKEGLSLTAQTVFQTFEIMQGKLFRKGKY